MVGRSGVEPLPHPYQGRALPLSYRPIGADDGSRTRTASLEGWCSTVELRPLFVVVILFIGWNEGHHAPILFFLMQYKREWYKTNVSFIVNHLLLIIEHPLFFYKRYNLLNSSIDILLLCRLNSR